jgi:hypothetical protein
MSKNYVIVLFKNKLKKKLIKSYITEKTATVKFKELLSKNQTVLFEKKYENATEVGYELGLLTNSQKIQKSLFITDELGRNVPVNLDNPDYVFLDIQTYKVEEKIFDWQKQKKISFLEFIKTYCKQKEFKSIFTLNNKICVQIDSNVNIFSLKNKEDSERFLEVTENYYRDNKRSDAMFVRDVSSAQRKWIYNTLEEKGFSKKRLYRLKTTFSKR